MKSKYTIYTLWFAAGSLAGIAPQYDPTTGIGLWLVGLTCGIVGLQLHGAWFIERKND